MPSLTSVTAPAKNESSGWPLALNDSTIMSATPPAQLVIVTWVGGKFEPAATRGPAFAAAIWPIWNGPPHDVNRS